ncbi:MAG: hypothetical protein MUO62_08735, partial [Anaerolineales bacterium]|nr:hypothetical protein [Anaerolineales bacterium]
QPSVGVIVVGNIYGVFCVRRTQNTPYLPVNSEPPQYPIIGFQAKVSQVSVKMTDSLLSSVNSVAMLKAAFYDAH